MAIFLTDPLIDSLKPKPPEEPQQPEQYDFNAPDAAPNAYYPPPQPQPQYDFNAPDAAPNVAPFTPSYQPPYQQPQPYGQSYDEGFQPASGGYSSGGGGGDVFSRFGQAANRGFAAIGQTQIDESQRAQEQQQQISSGVSSFGNSLVNRLVKNQEILARQGITAEGEMTPQLLNERNKTLEDADIPLWQKRAIQAAASPLAPIGGVPIFAGTVLGGAAVGALEMTPLEKNLEDAPLAVKVGVGIMVSGATFAATKNPLRAAQQLEGYVGPTVATALARGIPWAAAAGAGYIGTVAPYEAIEAVVGVGSIALAQKAGEIVKEIGPAVRFFRSRNPAYRATAEGAAAAEPEYIDVYLDPTDGVYKIVKDFVPSTERSVQLYPGSKSGPIGGGAIRMEAEGGQARIFSDPRDPNIARPRSTLPGIEKYISNSANDDFAYGEVNGLPVWSNGFIAVIGETRPSTIKGANRKAPTDSKALEALINSADRNPSTLVPVAREEVYKSGSGMNPSGIEQDVTYMRNTADQSLMPVDTDYLDYFTKRFGLDLTYQHVGGADSPIVVFMAGQKVGLLMPAKATPIERAPGVERAVVQFDEAGVSDPRGKAPKSYTNPAVREYEAALRQGNAGEAETFAEGERRRKLTAAAQAETGRSATYLGTTGEIRLGQSFEEKRLIEEADRIGSVGTYLKGDDSALERAAAERMRRDSASYTYDAEGKAARASATDAAQTKLIADRAVYEAAIGKPATPTAVPLAGSELEAAVQQQRAEMRATEQRIAAENAAAAEAAAAVVPAPPPVAPAPRRGPTPQVPGGGARDMRAAPEVVPAASAPAARPPGAVPPGGGGEIARPTLAERGLDKAKPKYGTRDVVFEDDIDKALYIVGNAMTKSKQHDRFMQFLRDATGGDNASIMAVAKARRAEIISMAKGSKTGDVIVRSSEPVAVAPEAVGGSGGGEPPVRPPAPPSEPDAVPPSDDAVPPQPAAATATPEQINQLTTFDFPKTLTSQMRANPILESGVAKSVAALQREIVYRTGGEGAETKAAGKSSQAAALFAAEASTAGLPADEALRIKSASLRGKYMLPGEPAGLTEAETNAVAEYVRGAAKAETEDAAVFLRMNIERAFRTLVLGVDRLQENQIEKLGMVFGSQFKATAKQVSEARLPRKTPLSAEQQAIVNEASDDAAREIATLEQQALAERETIADLSARASNLPNVTPTEKAIKARVEETIKKRVQTALKIENAAQKKAAAKQAKENPTIEQMLAQIEEGLAADPGATPASLEAVKYFLRHEMEYSASIPETTFPKAAAVRARIVGTVADRYLDRLLDQARVFVDAVQLSGVSEKTAKEVANLLTKASLKKRYGDVVPKRITDEVARANNAANAIVDGVAKLNQELKNIQFSLDLGVLGQQVNRAITSEAPIQTILGLIDQMLILAGKPMSFDSVTARMTYAEKLMSYANSGLAINVSSGEVDLKAGYGLLNKIPGVGAGVEALTNLQYVVILQRLRVMIFESNLEILYRSGGDITSPSARATAAAFANAATSTSRPALIPGRAQLERALLLTNMRRAQITSLVQQLQTLDPRSSAAQRKLGVIAIINHWVINKAILAALAGVAGATGSVIELDQSKKGYGSLTTKIKTAEGQNIVVPVSAQAQVEKAAARSVRELVERNPQNVIPILEGLITSSASPFAGAALKGVLRWGFDSNRGMQVGTASRLGGNFGYGQTQMEQIFSSGLAPVPVIGQSVLLGKESFRTLPFSVTGFSAFPESGTAAVKRDDYKDRTGNAAFDTISPAAWKKLSPQFKQETNGFLNITDWRARAADKAKAKIMPTLGRFYLSGELEDEIENYIKAESPFYAVYSDTRDLAQIKWINQNKELALAKQDEGEQLIKDNPGRADIAERAWKPSAIVKEYLTDIKVKRGAPVGAR